MGVRRGFGLLAAAALLPACAGPDDAAFQGWGGFGQRPGQFVRPRAAGVFGGEVYIIDTTGRIQVFDGAGAFRRQWRTPDASNGTPTTVAFFEGTVLVADTHYSAIREYTPEGDEICAWGTNGSEPGKFIYPTDVTRNPAGFYFVSEYGDQAERVQVFDADRRFVRAWGRHGEEPGAFNRAMSIAWCGGEVYVGDTANHRIQVFTEQGELLRIVGEAGTLPGQLKYPYDFALAPDRTVVVVEYGNNRLSRFTPQGGLLGTFGKPGRGPGEFHGPRAVAVGPDSTVYVADTGNHRVQMIPLEALS